MPSPIHRLAPRLALGLAVLSGLALGFAPAPAALAAPTQNNYTVHTVRPGETLYGIAAQYGVSAEAIAVANGLVNPNFIYIGQQLTIPGSYVPAPPPAGGPSGGTHVVRPGDTLYGIAWQYGTTISALMQANGLSNPNYIYIGQTLVIPGAQPPGPPPGGPPPGSGQPPAGCGQAYVVKPGDTLSGIAAWHHTSLHALAQANALRYPYIIYPGQSLHIPCGPGRPGHPGHKPPSRPAPKPTAKPGTPPLHPAVCAREVQITQPRVGEHVSGTVQIVGTADIPNFQFYKVEYAMGHNPLPSSFHSINGVFSQAVRDTVLATWYTGNMPAGAYTLRLTAVDNTGNYPPPCSVRMHIDR